MKRLHWISPGDPPDAFPPVDQALDDPPGLLAAGGDLSPARLVAAYRRGIFPWYSEGEPVLWWSPDPREVLFPAEFHESRSLARRLRTGGFEVTWNRDFAAVISNCAQRRRGAGGTWITAAMAAAYRELHAMGVAHSIEVWRAGRLAGGLYGVRAGAVFCGESMFSLETDASKVALRRLTADAPALGIRLIDCQMATAHLRSLGSRPMPRAEFLSFLP